MTGTDLKTTVQGKAVLKNGDFDLEVDLDTAVTNRMLRTSPGSWLFDLDIGVGLQDFTGLPNTEETGLSIEDRVVTGLRRAGVAAQCTVYPVSHDSVAIVVIVFTPGGTKTTKVQFRYEGGQTTYFEEPVEDTGFKTQRPVNKYERRFRGI